MRLQLSDPAYTEHLVDFLRSVGQPAYAAAPDRVEVEGAGDEAWQLEIALYVRVWRVLHPEAVVDCGPDILSA